MADGMFTEYSRKHYALIEEGMVPCCLDIGYTAMMDFCSSGQLVDNGSGSDLKLWNPSSLPLSGSAEDSVWLML